MIEAALVIPLILAIFFAGIEFTRALRTRSHLSFLIREVVDVAFRDCTNDIYDSLEGLSATQRNQRISEVTFCITELTDQRLPHYINELGSMTFSISVFRWDESQPLNEAIEYGGYRTDPEFHSLVQIEDFNYGSARYDLLRQIQALVYAELRYPYKSLMPPIARLFGFDGKEFYVSTVF